MHVLSPIENGCEAMAHSLLVSVPNKQAHAALSILKQGRILTPDVTEVGAITLLYESRQAPVHGSLDMIMHPRLGRSSHNQ